MTINIKKLRKSHKKGIKKGLKKSKKFARKKIGDIDHYLEINKRQALKMKPNNKKVRF